MNAEIESPNSCMAMPKTTWRDKLRWKLFPTTPCPLPEAPPSHKDVLVSRTTCHLSFLDRVRVLFSGRFVVETKTVTENEIGRHITASSAYPLPIKSLDREASGASRTINLEFCIWCVVIICLLAILFQLGCSTANAADRQLNAQEVLFKQRMSMANRGEKKYKLPVLEPLEDWAKKQKEKPPQPIIYLTNAPAPEGWTRRHTTGQIELMRRDMEAMQTNRTRSVSTNR